MKGYYRFPTVSGDRMVFVTEDDLWTAPLAGGDARRLSAAPGAVSHPRFSPDGRWLAFVADDEGAPDVWVMESGGSTARRLTFLGEPAFVAGWTPDGREVVFASAAGQALARHLHLRAVPVEGGESRLLPYGPCRSVAFGPGGGVVVGRFQEDPARWKRYRGGMAGTLWIDEAGSGEFRPLLPLAGNVVAPMWIGGRVFFLSDHEGTGDLYSCLPDGGDLRRHTLGRDHYARFPSTDGRTVVYQSGGELRAHDPATGLDRPVEVALRSSRPQLARRFVSAAENLESYALHPDGHSLALTARGQVFAAGNWEGPARRVAGGSGVRARLARYLGDGRRLVLVTDAGGEEGIEVHDAAGVVPPVCFDDPALGRPAELEPDPTSRRAAFANHRGEVGVVDLASGAVRVLDRSPVGHVEGLAWSADGAWLCWSSSVHHSDASRALLRLARVEDGTVTSLTDGRYRDFSPSFDPEGRYLYFLSARAFDPVYDENYFELGFPRATRPHLFTLRRDLRSPFHPEPRRPEGASDRAGAAPAAEAAPPSGAPRPVHIDLDGLPERLVPFPVPLARYRRLDALKGRVLFTRLPVQGSLGRSWREEGEPAHEADLLCWDHDRQELETWREGITDYRVSAGGGEVAWRVGWRLRVAAAARPKDADRPDARGSAAAAPGRSSGWVDLDRLAVEVLPRLEWGQMLRETWRMMRDGFWTSDMSGVDWQAELDRYAPAVDRLGARSELSDLIWEMQGELGTSHAYEMGGDYRRPPAHGVGHLAADVAWDPAAAGYRVVAVARGEPGDRDRSSPLTAPGAAVAAGDVLTAVDGEVLSATRPLGAALVRKAGREVSLRVVRADGSSGDVVVRTLTDPRPARYREWVLDKRRRTHALSSGRVGYVHVPDMVAAGFSEFHRDYQVECDRPALLVDARGNGGGHVSQLILEKLARRRIGYSVSRWGGVVPYPEASAAGPILALADEQSGSDGDIFTHAFRLLGLGLVVGKRTWGGVIGIWPTHRLVDGTVVTQPEYSTWFEDVGWSVENRGAVPDVEVEFRPQDHAAGRDPQLERGVELLLEALKRAPPQPPEFGPRPVLAWRPARRP